MRNIIMENNEKRELLKEGWVEFFRVYCKTGFIDYWVGDCINDPNLPSKNRWQLNAFVWYYRLNGNGKWVKSSEFDNIGQFIGQLSNDFDAKEIWESALVKKENIDGK
jgi:hypothetical protein